MIPSRESGKERVASKNVDCSFEATFRLQIWNLIELFFVFLTFESQSGKVFNEARQQPTQPAPLPPHPPPRPRPSQARLPHFTFFTSFVCSLWSKSLQIVYFAKPEFSVEPDVLRRNFGADFFPVSAPIQIFARFSGKVERLKMLASNFWAKKLCWVNVSQDGPSLWHHFWLLCSDDLSRTDSLWHCQLQHRYTAW